MQDVNSEKLSLQINTHQKHLFSITILKCVTPWEMETYACASGTLVMLARSMLQVDNDYNETGNQLQHYN